MQPNATALRFLGKTVTWDGLQRRVVALADALSRRGVGFGDRVMILMLNRTEFVESVLAVNSLGAIAVPLNFRLTSAEIAFLVEDCEARVLITESVLAPVATGVRDIEPLLDTIVVAGGSTDDTVLGYEDLINEPGDPHEPVDVPNDSPALIMYTSGTTGRPKGAVLTHTNLTGQTMTGLYTHGADINSDVGFVGVPFFHIAGIGNLLTGMLLGVPTVIYPLGAFDPGQLLDVLAAEKVTGIFLVPAQWQAVCAEQQARPRDLRLRVMSWGAAPAPDALLREMSATFPGTQILAAFGQTEMSPVTCMLLGEDAIRKRGSVGKVIPDGRRPGGRRKHERRARRRGRRDRLPGADPDDRLLEQPRGHGGGVRGRLVPFRRSGPDGRGRLRLGGGPQEGHDHLRRREHLLRRGGERSRRPSRHRRGRRSSAGPTRSGARCRSRSRPSPARTCGSMTSTSSWPTGWRATSTPRRSRSSTRCPATPPGRSSRPNCGSATGRRIQLKAFLPQEI